LGDNVSLNGCKIFEFLIEVAANSSTVFSSSRSLLFNARSRKS